MMDMYEVKMAMEYGASVEYILAELGISEEEFYGDEVAEMHEDMEADEVKADLDFIFEGLF